MDEKITKSTITITHNGSIVRFDVVHEPEPTGDADGWEPNVKAANEMVTIYKAYMEFSGAPMPIYTKSKSAIDGSVHITQRRNE